MLVKEEREKIKLKIKAFELLSLYFDLWHKDVTGSYNNDISKLKLFKLLFFASAVKATENDPSILTIFNHFCALPYGPVEIDVYSRINLLQNIYVDDTKLIILERNKIENCNLDDSKKKRIKLSYQALRNKNESLIIYPASKLVSLSHRWFSWKKSYAIAKSKGAYIEPIPLELICTENKYFF